MVLFICCIATSVIYRLCIINGVFLESLLVLPEQTIMGRWSDISVHNIPHFIFVLFLTDMYILSINVAVECVIRVGLVIDGTNPLARKLFRRSSVFLCWSILI